MRLGEIVSVTPVALVVHNTAHFTGVYIESEVLYGEDTSGNVDPLPLPGLVIGAIQHPTFKKAAVSAARDVVVLGLGQHAAFQDGAVVEIYHPDRPVAVAQVELGRADVDVFAVGRLRQIGVPVLLADLGQVVQVAIE